MTNDVPNLGAFLRSTCHMGEACTCAKEVEAMMADAGPEAAFAASPLVVTFHAFDDMDAMRMMATMALLEAVFADDPFVEPLHMEDLQAMLDVDAEEAHSKETLVRAEQGGVGQKLAGFMTWLTTFGRSTRDGNLATA